LVLRPSQILRSAISAFALVALSAIPAQASTPPKSATPPYIFFPPADCSAKELRIVVWQDGASSTRCATAQEILKLALPGCKAGQQVIFDGNAFACKELPKTGGKAAE